jgi:hypothetical protein
MIFHLLRSIRSERLIRDDSGLDTLEIIIKWLQVSVVNTFDSDKPFRLKLRFVFRDLVLSDQGTCTIASRVNFYNTEKLTPLTFEV